MKEVLLLAVPQRRRVHYTTQGHTRKYYNKVDREAEEQRRKLSLEHLLRF